MTNNMVRGISEGDCGACGKPIAWCETFWSFDHTVAGSIYHVGCAKRGALIEGAQEMGLDFERTHDGIAIDDYEGVTSIELEQIGYGVYRIEGFGPDTKRILMYRTESASEALASVAA